MVEQKPSTAIYSETAALKRVLIHTPGPEIENMTPESAQRALYSDILNKQVATSEYNMFRGVLSAITETIELKPLLEKTLEQPELRKELAALLTQQTGNRETKDTLSELSAIEFTNALIWGMPVQKNTLSGYMNSERFILHPLHNIFFMRDASFCIWDTVFISRMAKTVREREAMMMSVIFKHAFSTRVVNPHNGLNIHQDVYFEGGDIIVVSDKLILIGIGNRTTSQGVDYIISQLIKAGHQEFSVIVQELPPSPESFIHLDMVFTMLSEHECMVYAPLILYPTMYRTITLEITGEKVVRISPETNLISALNSHGIDVAPLICGGRSNNLYQEREQWHSGANFFAFDNGKVIGYGQNQHTLEELSKNGYEILTPEDVISGAKKTEHYEKCMIALDGSELARGGGGPRCMTLPVLRKKQ